MKSKKAARAFADTCDALAGVAALADAGIAPDMPGVADLQDVLLAMRVTCAWAAGVARGEIEPGRPEQDAVNLLDVFRDVRREERGE